MKFGATSKTLATNVMIAAGGIATSIIASRLLGATARGEIAAAMLWPSLLAVVANVGIIPSTLYYAARNVERVSDVITNATLIALLLGLSAAFAAYFAVPSLLAHQRWEVTILSQRYLALVPISIMTYCATSAIQARLEIGLYNFVRLIVPVGYFGSVAIFALVGRLSVEAVVLLNLAVNFAGLVAAYTVLYTLKIRFFGRPNIPLAKQMLSFGAKVHLGDLSQLGNLRMDQALIAAWLSPRELGVYVVAVNASSLGQLFSFAVRQVLVPRVASAASSESSVEHLRDASLGYCLVAIPATAALMCVLPFAIPFLLGPEFRGAVLPGEIMLIGTFFWGLKDILSGGAQGLGRPWLSTRAELYALAVTVLMLLLLLKTIGIVGAAITSVVAYTFASILLGVSLARIYSIGSRSLREAASNVIAQLRSSLWIRHRDSR